MTIENDDNHINALQTICEPESECFFFDVYSFFFFSDILASAIRLCVYPIDFSIYATCPRAHENSRELSVSLRFLC